MSFSSWHNAVRSNPISQEIIDIGKTRCACPENPNVYDNMTIGNVLNIIATV